ncbi:MAG: transporter substrate-binding domain-containing protein [Gammaproteobacteria bacterium]|nr:transporter substrate-binding domain-containing protein [Gammaproteobacteria bacterium]MBU1556693.1 transporter substrate-binding domain-containing protein [Gammaproteobacteria bacterium]MBU2070764.1 transporter substrate-binding domain-containing protein [Gammaproteobacteria bacterium]MBU2182755.1 transporter substrate-binding domain-containing protein [Gammaproteobacteria bacterium]MBU2206003.1 transporter substrate-binding domain-containing protein [Gammaproteobacteria bacterium]
MAKYWFKLSSVLLCTMAFAVMPAAEPTPADTASQKTLRFVVYHPDFPPYIFTTINGDVSGIVPDLLAPFFQQQQLEVDYLLDNRAGAEQRLYRGEVDAMMLSPEWAIKPEQLVFSNQIIAYDDYFFARTAEEAVTEAEQLKGKKICTREYYVYPTLEALFSRGTLLRVDSSSQEAQLRMVLSKRCDLAYMNDLIAHWLLQQHYDTTTLYPTPLLIGKSGLTIALHPNWQPLLQALNQYLQQQQASGEVERVIARYLH